MRWWCRKCNNITNYINETSTGFPYCPNCESYDVYDHIVTGAPVRLKSKDGPFMTVTRINDENIAECIYFSGDELKTINLPVSVLTFDIKENYCINDDDDDDYYDDDDDDYYDDDDDDYYDDDY